MNAFHPRLPRIAVSLSVALTALLLFVSDPVPSSAQLARVQPNPDAGEARTYGDLAEGPYNRLVLRNVMVLPGHGGPAVGPYDILITGNVIAEMSRHDRNDPDRMQGDRVIEGDGLFVMPGMINLHLHLREEALPLDYIWYMQLATGVTSVGPAEEGRVQPILEQVENNDILSPRLFPIYGWGSKTDYSQEDLMNPEMAPQIARDIIAAGVRQVYLNNLCWNPEMFGAAAQAISAAGGVTGVHIQPASTSQVNAMSAAQLGVSMIVHHYGYAESALDRRVQNYPSDYNYWDENIRFREAGQVWIEAGENPVTRQRLLGDLVDTLVAYGVTMQPNRATYEANRDIMRAHGLPWHEKYTHQALWEWHLPSSENHASFQYDWTSMDEYRWHYLYDLWGDLIFEFNKKGGRVAYGTDDNYQWSTGGFGNIRELQLVLESGMHPLEVLQTATFNSAEFLMEPKLGLVQEGYIADLLVVDGSPAHDFKYLYPFGAIRMNDEREMYRTKGILHTIKDGIVTENDAIMREVARIVAESKRGVGPDIVTEPFTVPPPPRPIGSGGNQ
jgi:hypothetical protein